MPVDVRRAPDGRSGRAAPLARLAPHGVLGAFIGGLLSALALAPPLWAGAAGVAAAGVGCVVLVARGRAGGAVAALALTVAVAGWTWGGARLEATRPPALPAPAAVRGTVVVDAPLAPDGRGAVRGRALADRLRTAAGRPVPGGARLLLELRVPAGRTPRAGQRLRVWGRLGPAATAGAPGWWRAHLARERIAGRLRVDGFAPAGRRGGLAGLRDRWRRWATERAGAGLHGDRAALVRGMALGGGGGLSEPAQQAFRDAGLWHLLAVSGQNVGVVAIAALAGLRALGVGRRAAVGAALGLIVAYCLACQGGASVARAGVVGALAAVAELRSAGRERWYLLLAGLAALLAAQPRAIGDPGLQLSFAAVVGLFLVAPPAAAWMRGWLPAPMADLVALAVGAGMATAPVLAWQFGRLSLVGLVVNVVAVPVAGPVVVLALLGLAVGALAPALGLGLAWAAGIGAAGLLGMARLAAAVPGAAVDLPALAAVPLAGVAAAVPLAAWWLGRPGADWTAPRRRRRTVGVLAALVLALAGGGGVWVAGRGAPAAWPRSPTVTALDVGQGDAVLLRAPDGAAVLVDAGPPGSPPRVLAALRRAGVRRLALVVLSHGSLDHVGGLAAVLQRHPVGVLVHPELGPALRAAQDALAQARRRGTSVRLVAAGAEIRAGAWRLRVLSPRAGVRPVADPNPASLVVLASAGSFDALLTADAESRTVLALAPGPVEVLKVAHHGSADAGLPALLARLRPAAALLSLGAGNAYGHPAPATLAALAAAGVPAWRTDRSGDVTVAPAAGGVEVSPAG